MPLRLLLLVALIEVLAWSVVTAPFQGPDEAAHYAYTQYLAETGHKPSYDGGGGIVSRETDGLFTGFNLYTLKRQAGARPFWTKSEQDYWQQYEDTLHASDRANGSGPNSVAKNPPLYYALEAVPYKVSTALGAEPFARVFWMRLVDALLFLATVWLTWLIASELFASALLRTAATATVVLLPMAAFMGGAVNPDNLLAALFAGALLVSLRLLQRGFELRRVLALAALAAAALLTHGRGLPLLAFALLAVLLAAYRHRPAIRPAAIALGAGAAVLLVGVVAYKLFLTGANAGGGAYGGELHFRHAFRPGRFIAFVWQFYFPKLPGMGPRPGPNFGFLQFFIEGFLPGAFGGQEARFSDDTYRLMHVLVTLAFVGFVVAAVGLRTQVARRWDVALLVLAFVVVPLLFLHLASFRAVLDPGATDALIVGRYLLPMVPALGLAVALMLRALRDSWREVGVGVLVALGLLLQFGALGLTAARFYA